MEYQASRPRRPLGVTIIATVLIIYAVFELLVGILAIVAIFAVGHAISSHGHTTTASVVDVVGGVLGGVSLLIGVLTLIFALGLWFLKRWAFWLTVIVEVISLLRHGLEFTHSNPAVVSIVIGMIVPVVILAYLFLDRNVRAAFRI